MIDIKGCVTKKGEKWFVVIELPRVNGKRRQKWRGSWDTKKEAEKALPKLLLEVQNGYHASLEKMTVSNYLEKYLSFKEDTFKPNTYHNVSVLLRKIGSSIGAIELAKLSALNIQEYLKAEYNRGVSRNYVKFQYEKLKQALNQAKRWKLISYNPCDDVVTPKTTKPHFYVYNDKEVLELLKSTKGTSIYTPILLASTVALRRGEIVALTWSDIDFKARTIRIDKSSSWVNGELITSSTKTDNSERVVHMPNILYNHLKSTRGIGNVCKRDTAPYYNPQILYNDYKEACRKLGITETKFHSLRHYCSSTMLSKGVPIKLVSDILGHTQISFTLRVYGHLMPNDHEKAVTVLNKLFG